MRTPENPRRGILPISAPPRERVGAPVLPKPEVGPALPPEPKLPSEKKPLLRRLAGSLAVRLVAAGLALGGVGYAGYETYQNVPAVHEKVDGLFGREIAAPVIVPPDTFSNKADKGVISAENTMALSLEEIQKKFPQQIVEDKTNYTATILFPFQAPEGEKIEYGLYKFNTKDMLIREGLPPYQDAVVHYLLVDVPKGTRIFSPLDARIALGRISDEKKIDSIALFYYDPEQDATYLVGIGYASYPNPYSFNPEPSVKNLNMPPPTTDWESYPEIKKGTPIASAAQDQSVVISVKGYKGKIIDRIRSGGTNKRFVSPQFFTEISENSIEKLVEIKRGN